MASNMQSEIIEGFRVSSQQERLWRLQSESQSTAYRAQCAVMIDGALHAESLRVALGDVVKRHEILRTTFHCLAGMTLPVQVVNDPDSADWISWTVEHYPSNASFQTEKLIEELFRLARQKRHDLESGPLVHASLTILNPDCHVLVLDLPALCADRWSLRNIVAELSRSYATHFGESELYREQSEAMQYADFCAWQNELFDSGESHAGRNYWRQESPTQWITRDLPFERLATEYDRNRLQTEFASLSRKIHINQELGARIEQIASESESSVSTLLLACWQVLLWRLTGQAQIVVGTTNDGRSYEELEATVGPFAKCLPATFQLDEEMPFITLMKKSAATILEVDKAQEYFRWDEIKENQNGTQFLFYCFDYAEQPVPFIATDVTFELIRENVCSDRYKVLLTCGRRSNSLWAEFHYDSALFDDESIELLSRQYEKLLISVVNGPGTKLRDLEIVSDTERRHLLGKWNETDAGYAPQACLHELFESQVERSPDAVAVINAAGEQLSYNELNARANQLAHLLIAIGVVPESRIALLLERSAETVISILAVLKAGASYLPLDPELPAERLSFMLVDGAPQVLITDMLEAVTPPLTTGLAVIRIHESGGLLNQQSPNNPKVVVGPSNLAYAIYTSGSSGTPKAVAVEHQSICNRLLWMQQEFPLATTDRVLQKTAYSFDASIWELLLPLLSGAQVVLAKAGGQRDSGYLVALMEQAEVTVLQMVPSMLAVLLDEPGLRRRCPKLRRVFCGGEALRSELQKRFYDELGEAVELVNLYGPTEASIDASFRRCSPIDIHRGRVMIGRPIANMQLYVLDQRQRLLPVGASGELYLGGIGVARGYLHRPELTAERFIPSPWSAGESERLYRTGDMARWLSDGELEYLGRTDQQVKIRGYRIELGEVEAALHRQEGISEAVVVAHEHVAGEKRLVAYVVLDQQLTSVSNRFPEELRLKLGETLPDYMIPPVFWMMESMPRLGSGKIDRNALPVPELAGQQHDHVVPRSQVEEVIAGIWGTLLNVEDVGVADNFFELGGHSLLATQLVSRVRKAFQVELPLRTLFDSPTVAGMAENIQLLMREESFSEPPRIIPVPRTGELALSFAQQRLWFLDQLQPASAFYNLPAAIRLTGQLNLTALQRSFDEIVRRHESLRTTVTSVDGRPTQSIAPALIVTIMVEDLHALSENRREARALELATEEVQRPFDIATGPLFRVRILQLSEEEHILLLTIHHIISDGWSSAVLIREMVALYEAHANGNPLALPELPLQYADFAEWQRSWLQGEVLQKQLDHWRKRLAGAPATLELPTDHPRPKAQTFRGGRQSISLSAAMLSALKMLGREEAVTLFMTLLAVFKVMLARYSGQEDIVVGTPIAGRNHVETENLIGFFVNTLVLRTDLSGNPTFQELLARIRETALSASAYQDLPFEKLVEELQPARDLDRSPIFQVMFALQNRRVDSYELENLILEPVETDTGTAKFDLELYFEETNDGLAGTFEYNSDLFDKSTIQRMAKHYEILLEAIVANPKQRIQRLQMLTESECAQQVAESSGVMKAYPLERSFDELFREQVGLTPQAIAVVSESGEVSYRELNERANQVAQWLRAAGVGADAVVGLLAERSVELLIGMLGLFKVGAAYLPLDPRQPGWRQQQVVQQSGIKLVLASGEYGDELREALAGLPEATQPQIQELEQAWQAGSPWSKAAVIGESRPAQLAYVIYTSGSTGVPKGAMITQAGMVNHLCAKVAELELGAGDRVAQTATQSFDISVWQFLAALLVGGQVRLVSDEVGLDPQALLRLVKETGVTVLETVPSMLGALLEELEVGSGNAVAGAERLGQLRWLIATGEALAPELCRRWAAVGAGQTQLLNAYGPTECADDVTHYEVREAPAAGVVRTPIGRALGNTRLYVVNKALTLLPRGVVGELYVGGVGVGRGYLQDAARTALSFGPDPFSGASGGRLYRTGDLVRQRADGELEYVGRIDQQVKVRGYRIELGEIEAVLSGHAAVQAAVVVLAEERGERRLVGYVVRQAAGNGNGAVGVNELRAYLRERLPEYMVPQTLVLLAQLPLTANGKIDRKASSSPDFTAAGPERTFIAPRDHTEQTVAAIWSEVLGLQEISVDDNFFNIGGHSLLATQVVSRLRKRLAIEMPLRTLFESPTIASLAIAIANIAPQQTQPEISAIRKRPPGRQDLNDLLAKVQQLSEGEARQLLDQMKNTVTP
jgi:amino acid adenylation domain-containing protein